MQSIDVEQMAYCVNRSTIVGLLRRKLKKDRCDKPFPVKHTKPTEYNMNMRRNDVYDGI